MLSLDILTADLRSHQSQHRDCPHSSFLLSNSHSTLTLLARAWRKFVPIDFLVSGRLADQIQTYSFQKSSQACRPKFRTAPTPQSNPVLSPATHPLLNDRPPAHDGVLKANHRLLRCMCSRDLALVEWARRFQRVQCHGKTQIRPPGHTFSR